jgi:hypothetical protein
MTTNAAGNYNFTNLPPGDYYITVNNPGYDPTPINGGDVEFNTRAIRQRCSDLPGTQRSLHWVVVRILSGTGLSTCFSQQALTSNSSMR